MKSARKTLLFRQNVNGHYSKRATIRKMHLQEESLQICDGISRYGLDSQDGEHDPQPH